MRGATIEQLARYQVKYRGHVIELKRDFGMVVGEAGTIEVSGFHLIDGMPCAWGYVVTDGMCNIMPGATWFQTVKEAKHAIDVLLETGTNVTEFWRRMRPNPLPRVTESDLNQGPGKSRGGSSERV